MSGSRSYIETEAQVLVKQMDFRFRDGSDGSIFLISQLNQILPETQDWLFDTVVAILLILVLTKPGYEPLDLPGGCVPAEPAEKSHPEYQGRES